MTGRHDFDQELAGYFEARATSRAPDGLLQSVLASVRTTGQRPGWIVPDRWLGSRPAAVQRTRRLAIVVAVLVVVALLGVALTVFVGSRHRLPPPFGLARPGLITFDLGGDLFVVESDGTGRRQLTSGPDADFQATFSPDGALIAYESELASDLSEAVVVISPNGDGREVVADHLYGIGNLAWSPDSRRIAFNARIAGSSSDHLYVADIDHPGATPLGPADIEGKDPRWSPNGRQLAFKFTGPCCDRPPNTLWLIGADGSNPHLLSARGGTDNALWNTEWSPDGGRLAFLASGVAGSFDVFVINADGTGLKNVSNTPEDEYWPTWSPDGTKLAFPHMTSMVGNQGFLVVVPVDGGKSVTYPGTTINSNEPVWSPDGKRVAAYEKSAVPGTDENDAIVIFDLEGHNPPTFVSAPKFTGATWQRLAP